MNENEEIQEQTEQQLEETEETLEAIGNALLSRLDEVDVRLNAIEGRLGEHLTSEHHSHESHESPENHETEGSEPPATHDEEPEPAHPWARRIGA